MLTSRRIQNENCNYGSTGKHLTDQENTPSAGLFGAKTGSKVARKGQSKFGIQSGLKGTLHGPAGPRKALGDITNATPVHSSYYYSKYGTDKFMHLDDHPEATCGARRIEYKDIARLLSQWQARP